LKADGGLAEVRYQAFDISNNDSIKEYGEYLKEKHPEGIDFGVYLGDEVGQGV
jgi:hypothetical protein